MFQFGSYFARCSIRGLMFLLFTVASAHLFLFRSLMFLGSIMEPLFQLLCC